MTISFEVTGIADHGAYSEDGKVELIVNAGPEELSLWMSLDTLQSLATSASELFLAARTRVGARHDPLATTAVPVDAVKAEHGIGAGLVILSIRDGVGLVHRFALHPEQSERLRPQLRAAETKANGEAKETRQ